MSGRLEHGRDHAHIHIFAGGVDDADWCQKKILWRVGDIKHQEIRMVI